jgi:hypothetical protein
MSGNENAGLAAEQKREWLNRGCEECLHYWVGTGERADGREKFVCRWCGAAMTEPLELSPCRKVETRIPPGCVLCESCGEVAHWSQSVKNSNGDGRVCLECLAKLI